MKNEFALAFNEVLEEKQLPREIILEALEAAMVSAYRRAVNASTAQHVEAKIDPETGRVRVFAEKEVVDAVQDDRTEVALEDAQKVDPEAKLGGMVVVETTPQDFGRVAAQTARQVIQQRIREAERDAQLSYFNRQLGEIVSGVVQAIGPQGITLGLDMKAEGIMPRNQQIAGERFRLHDRVRALLAEVKSTPRGPQLVLSRAHRNFLRRLLENEVPEIYHGLVEIRSIAREPGQRSKVAVAALQSGVDPVGACVGIRGVRIQAIVRELNDEKIDVIEWNPDPAGYIAKALSPARVTGVYLNDQSRGTKTATVVVPEDQLSLAIGRDGQNARLAAKLTAWRIDIKSLPEAASDALHRLQSDPEFTALAEKESGIFTQVESILTKKSEGRPVTPEEYSVLSQFVDRVERSIIGQRQEERRLDQNRRDEILASLPSAAFEMQIDDLDLPERVNLTLSDAGLTTIGELMLQMKMDSDAILGLNGIGPKTLQDIETALAQLSFPEEALPEATDEPAGEAAQAIEEEAGGAAPAEAEAVLEPESQATEGAVAAEAVAEIAQAEPAIVEQAREEAGAEATGELLAPVELEAPEAAILDGSPPTAPSAEESAEKELEEELPATLDELFTLKPEVFDVETMEIDEEEEEEETSGGKKKKKKKKKFVEMEYDPDKDVVIVKRKRKRGGEWDDEWSL